MDLRTIRHWDVGALEQVETALAQRIRMIEDVRAQVSEAGGLSGWAGQAAEAARQRFTVTSNELTDELTVLEAVRTVTGETRAAVAHLRAQLADLEKNAATDGFEFSDDGTIAGGDAASRSHEESALRERRRVELRARARALITQAAETAADAAAVLSRASGGEAHDRDVPGSAMPEADRETTGHLTAPAPPADTSPAAARAYWEALPESQRREVIARHPEWVGNRDGIPSLARHEANTNRIGGERRLLEDRCRTLRTNLANHPFGGAFTDEDAELALVESKLTDLDKIEQLVAENPMVPGDENDHGVRLLLLDMVSGERGMAALAIGDPDNADHVSVTVPGKDTTITSLCGMVAEGKALRTETEYQLDRLGRGDEKVATIAWLGYEPPVSKGGPDDFAAGWLDAARTDRAEAGAPRLARFLDGIDVASNSPDPHLTALGHSYGSYTLARALQDPAHGQPVDDAVFYGSPGINASDEPDLGLRQGHGYVLRAADDPITLADTLRTFGPDPVTTRLEQLSVAAGTTADGIPREAASGHSEYPRPSGTGPYEGELRTSGYNMAVIIGGLPAELLHR
ncbi:alpha/beta hydrolase [Nocardia takedensis]